MADETTENDDAAKARRPTPSWRSRPSRPRWPPELPAGESTEALGDGAGDRSRSATKAEEPAEDGPRPNRRKVREGIVVSDAMTSTVIVAVVERVRHPRYGKTVQRTKRLYVHDAKDSAKVGDRVRVRSAGRCPSSSAGACRSGGAGPMIQQESRLRVADNSGAREVLCIRCSVGRAAATPASVTLRGDRQGRPRRRVKKGDVVSASSCARRRRSAVPTAATSASTRTPPSSSTTSNTAGHPHLRPGWPGAAR